MKKGYLMKKHIIIIHGRNFKPNKKQLEKNWIEALHHGLEREGKDVADLFSNTKKTFVYFGEESNRFLRKIGKKYDEHENTNDRKITLSNLKKYKSEQFNRSTYEHLPGKTALKEAVADAFGGALSMLGVADKIISSVAPDMAWYWEKDSQFGSDIRWNLTEVLSKAFRNNEEIILISHSLGTMIAYDVLWKFSHYGEYRDIKGKKLDLWLTLGSPLGDETVKNNLKGANLEGKRKYPTNIKKWINVAAEDDYICHDQAVENDYRSMLTSNIIDFIIDHRIYNLATCRNKSNPHHGVGYLIHPTVSKIITEWLN